MSSDDDLVEAARMAREQAWAPMSGYRVGAALRDADGRIWTGCNVEHVVLPETVCAEKTAIVKAVSEGARRFPVAAVFTDSDPPATPCGSCRQMLHAWGVEVVWVASPRALRRFTLSELLPAAFALDLGKAT
jgi:cytidine deaminase